MSRSVNWVSLQWLAVAVVGCGFGDDPFAGDSGVILVDGEGGADGVDDGADDGADDAADGGPGGDGGGDDGADDGGDDGVAESGGTDDGAATGGTDGGEELVCLPSATRLVVFGDSIFACFGPAGGKNSDNCSAKIIADYISDNYGPVSYENLAVNGAVTRDVPDSQMPGMEVKPGHAIVLIFIGGNDLAQYIFSSDEQAESGWNQTAPEVAQKWEEIFAFIEDPANFPDGATVIMNTQYNPFDDCTAAPYASVTPYKTMLLHEHNDALVERADARDYAFMVDQHPSYLGHGHHADKSECPHYIEGASNWMADVIHPDVEGHRHLADEIQAVIDTFYAGC
jgi:lysophospholipase L1-like esterase